MSAPASSSEPLVVAADGSALGNPGPAGWAWYVDETTWHAGGWPHGTNNMGELKAVLDLLESTSHVAERPLHILCDSQYVINCITRWMPGWKRNGWKKKDRKPVLNRDLLEALDAALQGRTYSFEWVKGHAGYALNEAADRRARAAATAYQAGRPPETGPGFPDAAGPTAGGIPAASGADSADAQADAEADVQTEAHAPERAEAGSPVSGGGSAHVRVTAPAEQAGGSSGLGAGSAAGTPEEGEQALCRPRTYESPQALAVLLDETLVWVTARGMVVDRARAMQHPQAAFGSGTDLRILHRLSPAPGTEVLVSSVTTSRGPVLRTSTWAVAEDADQGPRRAAAWTLRHRQDTPVR